MTPRLWLSALALGLATATSLGAQTAPEGFAAFDTDGDGTISPAEWAAALDRLPPRMAENLRSLTAEPDPREVAAAQRLIARFDRDGDGRLDARELAAAMTVMSQRAPRAGILMNPDRGQRFMQDRMQSRAERGNWRDRSDGPRDRDERGSWRGDGDDDRGWRGDRMQYRRDDARGMRGPGGDRPRDGSRMGMERPGMGDGRPDGRGSGGQGMGGQGMGGSGQRVGPGGATD